MKDEPAVQRHDADGAPSAASLRLVLPACAEAANPEPTPLERLLVRLDLDDGPEWFERRRAVSPWRDLSDDDALLHGRLPVAELRRFKEECKRTFSGGRDADAVLYAVAGYFVAIA